MSELPESRGRTIAAGALLFAMLALAYFPATQAGFIWDDDVYVTNNETLTAPDGLAAIWLQLDSNIQYYPLVFTSYWIESRLWGLAPAGFHVVNILLHGLCALLLWRVLTQLQVPAAWLGAAVFALHPVQVESVAWVTERKNVLSGVFYMGSALAYLRYALRPPARSGRSIALYILSLLFFACAVLSKTVTSTLPAALLLVLWWKRGRIAAVDLRGLAPFFALGVGFGLVTVWIETHHVGASGEAWNLSFIERSLIAGHVVWFYAAKLIWPTNLTFIYPRWEIDAHAWPQYLYPLSALTLAAVLWGLRKRIGRGPVVAVLGFGGTLFPALGFFDVFPMLFSWVADHFQYLASAFLIVPAVAAAERGLRRIGGRSRSLGGLLAIVLLTTLGALTWSQAHVYRDAETLWRDTIRKNPQAWIGHTNLGGILMRQGKPAQALVHLRQAERLRPNGRGVNLNIGITLLRLGRPEEAIEPLEIALQSRPDSLPTRIYLGAALLESGRVDEAIKIHQDSLLLYADSPEVHAELAKALVADGQLDAARRHRLRAQQLRAMRELGAR